MEISFFADCPKISWGWCWPTFNLSQSVKKNLNFCLSLSLESLTLPQKCCPSLENFTLPQKLNPIQKFFPSLESFALPLQKVIRLLFLPSVFHLMPMWEMFQLFCEKDEKCLFLCKKESQMNFSIFCQIFGRIPKPKHSQLYSRLFRNMK